jgi:hypothetical protein
MMSESEIKEALKKLDEKYDPKDKLAALTLLHESGVKGEFATGLIYIEDLGDTLLRNAIVDSDRAGKRRWLRQAIDELVKILPAPDFPTGGVIMGTAGIRDAYATGRGKCVVRGVAEIVDEEKNPAIIITEVPFQVNKARLVEQIAELVKETM